MWGWWEVAAAVQSGDVVTDLLKPFDYFVFWLSRDLGRAACHVLTRFLPTFLVGLLLYDLALPSFSLTSRSAETWISRPSRIGMRRCL